jgi:hypothetical protein
LLPTRDSFPEVSAPSDDIRDSEIPPEFGSPDGTLIFCFAIASGTGDQLAVAANSAGNADDPEVQYLIRDGRE